MRPTISSLVPGTRVRGILRWVKKSSPEYPIESPIPFRTGSNGEFEPRVPCNKLDRVAEETFRRAADGESEAARGFEA